MHRLLQIFHALWVIGLGLLGVWLGAEVGYASGGLIGAVCLGTTGPLLSAFLGAGGARLALQLLS